MHDETVQNRALCQEIPDERFCTQVWSRYVVDHSYIDTWSFFGLEQNLAGPAVGPEPGAWDQLKLHVQLNTPGAADGLVELWINGVKKLEHSDVNIRESTDYGMNKFILSTYATDASGSDGEQWFDDIELSLADPTPDAVAITRIPLNSTAFSTDDGEVVVLSFRISSNSPDAEVSELTVSASGEMNEAADISRARLYLDDNRNETPEPDEEVAEDTYHADDGEITFVLDSAHPLPAGDTHFLVTYQFQ